MQQNNQNKINVNVSEKDVITCVCGSQGFIRTTRIAKVKSPIIGQKDIAVPFPPDRFICSSCGKTIDEIIKEKENGSDGKNEGLEKT